MAITKTTTTSIKDASVEEANINNCAATVNKIGADAVTSAKINNGTVTADDLAPTLDLSSKTVTLPSDAISFDREYYNIGLLGFKMAVNESLTVFNLVDGVVDEFNDESGTDEAEGSNDNYVAASDFYINSSTPDGNPIGPYSAGFSLTSVTEPDTSTAGTNPAYGSGTMAQYTVPACVSSLNVKVWGAGGDHGAPGPLATGGGGGFATGNLSVSPGQSFYVIAGEGGSQDVPQGAYRYGGRTLGSNCNHSSNTGSGGGVSGLFGVDINPLSGPQVSAPQVYMIAGSGGGGGGQSLGGNWGGAGGGLTGDAGGQSTEQTTKQSAPSHPSTPSPYDTGGGGGGGQTQGGNGGCDAGLYCGQAGSFLQGGNGTGVFCARLGGGGGAGYYGGGGGAGAKEPPGSPINYQAGGGGGSSYIGHPQVTCGSTEEGSVAEGGGTADPDYVPGTNEGGTASPDRASQDGYVLLSACQAATAVSTTIVSEPFTSTSVATSARIVVFEENIDTPTLNTDIIASVSRDGTNFTNATLSDSGYVTGSSGQRILTGQADISGQPSGQSMRWKLQLANNQVKIHGVSLSWA